MDRYDKSKAERNRNIPYSSSFPSSDAITKLLHHNSNHLVIRADDLVFYPLLKSFQSRHCFLGNLF